MTRHTVLGRILLLALLQCMVLGSLTAPAVVGLSVIVRRFVGEADAHGVLAAIGAAGAATAMIASPAFGWLADRTRGPLGRRCPWLIGGALAGLTGTAFMAWAPDATTLGIAWVATQAAYCACYGAINGLISQGLPPEERTRMGGIFSAAGFLGALPGLAIAAIFPSEILPMLLTVPAVAAVVIVVVALRLEDPPRPPVVVRSARAPAVVASLVSAPFVAAFVARMVIAIELTAGLVFALYLFLDRWGISEESGVRMTALSTLLGAAALIVASLALATTPLRHVSPRLLLICSLLLLIVGMLGRGFAPTLWVFQVATIAAGLGIGGGMTSSRSIAQAALPPHEAALGLGVFNASNNIGPIVAPLLAAWLLDVSRTMGFADPYTGMYLLLAAPVAAVAALLVCARRMRRAPAVAP